MAKFRYKGRHNNGNQTNGVVEAETKQQAIQN